MFQYVVPCAGNATKAEIKLFTDLYKRRGERKVAQKRAEIAVSDDISQSQEEVSQALLVRKGAKKQRTTMNGYAR